MDIFVGSLPFKFKEKDLEELFSAFGEVLSVKIIIDKATRQNKGFGFVEMKDRPAGLKAIRELDGSEHLGRAIVVSEAQKNSTGEATHQKPRQWNKGKKKNNDITYG